MAQIQSDALLNEFTYIRYMKKGELNQGVLQPQMDPLLAKIKKVHVSGQKIDNKIKIAHNATAGPNAEDQFTLARANVGTGETVSFERKWNDTHSWGFVNEKVLFQTLMGGAAYNELDEKVQENKLAMNVSILRDFWGNNTGIIGKVTTYVAATNVVTVPVNVMNYIFNGMRISFTNGTASTNHYLVDGANKAPTIANISYVVSGCDYRKNTFKIDRDPSHTASTPATGGSAADALAAGDYIWFPGGFGVCRTKGVLSYTPETIASNDSFLGVNRSKAPSTLAGYYKNVTAEVESGDFGGVVWDNIIDSVAKVTEVPSGEKGVNLDGIYCNYNTFTKLTTSDIFKDNLRWTNNDARGNAKLGFSGIVFTTPHGDIPLYKSNSLPDYEFFGTDSSCWEWLYLAPKSGDFLSFARRHGDYVFLDEKSNLLKFRLFNYNNLMCKRPRSSFRLKFSDVN